MRIQRVVMFRCVFKTRTIAAPVLRAYNGYISPEPRSHDQRPPKVLFARSAILKMSKFQHNRFIVYLIFFCVSQNYRNRRADFVGK